MQKPTKNLLKVTKTIENDGYVAMTLLGGGRGEGGQNSRYFDKNSS